MHLSLPSLSSLQLVLCFPLMLISACGGAASESIRVTPMTSDHMAAFDNGIDLVDDPSLLEGSWLEEWENEISQRTRLADTIAIVRVSTVREDVDPDGRQARRLEIQLERVRRGPSPESTMYLVSKQQDGGFASVLRNERRILGTRYIAFFKWTEENGRITARFHLAPATERVARRVNSLIESSASEGERRRVIVRETRN